MEEIANMNINGKHLSIGRKWVCTELPRERSFLFGRLLEDHCFNFETSEVGKLMLFQVLASETKIEFLNKFIDNNY